MKIGLVAHGPIQVPVDGRDLRAASIGLWCHHVARTLAKRGVEPVVYHEGSDGQARGRSRHDHLDGVDYVGLPTGLDHRARRLMGRGQPVDFGSRWYYPHYFPRIGLDARRRDLDVLVVANFSQAPPVFRRLHPRARVMLHMHCDWLVQLDRAVVESRLRACDLIGGVTDHVARAIADRFTDHADRCVTLPNGVAADAYGSPDPEDGLILFVGRSSPEKGLHVLVEAFGSVAERHPAARLRLVGPTQVAPRDFIVDISSDPTVRSLARFYDGAPYHEQLAAMVPSACRDRVTFVGPLTSGGVAEEYGRAEIVVLPAVGPESFGMPVIEAGAAGRPVVVTAVGGLPEVVDDGATGLVVPRDDPVALAGALSRLLDDRALGRALGREGRRRVLDRFTWDAVGDRLLEVLAR